MGKIISKKAITKRAREWGADLVGFAPVSRWQEFNEVEEAYRPQSIWPETKIVIVLGVPVLLPILETTPSIHYVTLYDTTNVLLDQIAYRLSVYLNDKGFGSIFLPRDGYGDINTLVEKPCAAFSQVFAAKYAGLGTIGYNHTLLNEKYGPRVRYVSVFTQLELEGNPIIEKDLCCKCRLCQKICPSQAFTTRKNNIIAAMDKKACAQYHAKLREENRYPCGICIKVCPIGQDRKLYNSNDSKLYLAEKAALSENPDDARYRRWVHIRQHGSKGDRIF